MLVIFTGSSGSVRAKTKKTKPKKPKTQSHGSKTSGKSALHRWSGGSGGSGVFHICIPGKPLGEIAGAPGGRMCSPPQGSFQPDLKAPCRIKSPEKKNVKKLTKASETNSADSSIRRGLPGPSQAPWLLWSRVVKRNTYAAT